MDISPLDFIKDGGGVKTLMQIAERYGAFNLPDKKTAERLGKEYEPVNVGVDVPIKDKYSNYDAPGYRFLKREKVKDFEPEIKHILESKIDFFLKKYFKSNYKIFWVNILQMTPVKNHDDDESLLWHYDDNPTGILKIFIYCSNQDKDTGAFTFIELEKSEKIKCEGFFTYTTEDRIKNQNIFFKNIDNTDINIAAGDEGSILVFQNNIVHKGNLPLRDKRNLIVLEVMPSLSKMSDGDLRKVLKKPFTIDFPRNPFLNN